MGLLETKAPRAAGTAQSVEPGNSAPLGATVTPSGVNFSVFSRNATGVDLLLFDHEDDPRPAREIPLGAGVHCTYHYWHVHVPGVRPGQIYAYRAHGPFDPGAGRRFDSSKVLLDPYGRAVLMPRGFERAAASRPGDNTQKAMKSVVVDPGAYDWEGDVPLRRPCSRTIVYEMHVRGFTRHPSSGVHEDRRGTYAGLIEKIPYLQDLGISAVELLPVFQFDPQDAPPGLVNYWGYQPVSFFAPHQAYASRRDALGPVDEFRDMVKALHRAGIEVILDVVFNHTAEGTAEAGPTYSLKGFDSSVYYVPGADPSTWADYSGCGNTLNSNHPVVRRMILDSLRYWVQQMHVDGFRFDLASILARDESGQPLPNPPVLWDIDTDPVLAGTKLIAEAWDAAGLYQVGAFVGDSWREWNGRFRDDIRSFLRAEPGAVKRFADRIIGSPEIFRHERREAEQSINFVTCHDGFTLNDLVSYDRKHNEPNGENNRDGTDDNRSWNCGVEGPTDDPAVESLRTRQAKNFLTVTLIALGMPMILMGDEVRRTQRGNNNAYCHDNELTWFDWTLLDTHAELLRFVSLLNERRQLRSFEADDEHVTLDDLLKHATFSWHGTRLGEPDWSDSSRSIALSIEMVKEQLLLHLMFNAYWEALTFQLPRPVDGCAWHRWIDTSLASPEDIVEWRAAPRFSETSYRAAARSVAILLAPLRPGTPLYR